MRYKYFISLYLDVLIDYLDFFKTTTIYSKIIESTILFLKLKQ